MAKHAHSHASEIRSAVAKTALRLHRSSAFIASLRYSARSDFSWLQGQNSTFTASCTSLGPALDEIRPAVLEPIISPGALKLV
jgi:hypothetical protein